MKPRFILCDLDGTLAHKTWVDNGFDPTHIGDPIPLMLARVKQWVAEGHKVIIFSARMSMQHTAEERALAARLIEAWTLKWVGKALPASADKDWRVSEIWDDRAVQVEVNTGRRVDGGL